MISFFATSGQFLAENHDYSNVSMTIVRHFDLNTSKPPGLTTVRRERVRTEPSPQETSSRPARGRQAPSPHRWRKGAWQPACVTAGEHAEGCGRIWLQGSKVKGQR